MDKSRTKNFTVADGVSFADVVDRNSKEDSTGECRLRSNVSGNQCSSTTPIGYSQRRTSLMLRRVALCTIDSVCEPDPLYPGLFRWCCECEH